MILSVSRRTDIPAFYSEWFYNRMRDGYVLVKNPMNIHQVSKISLSPEVVDCIVFWSKNPAPMLPRLDELKEYRYYFQFTLDGYGREIEPAVPDKSTEMIDTFRKLSEKVGSSRVIWRYDPIMLTPTYTADYHRRAFEQIAMKLDGYTDRVVISFIDLYTKTLRNTEGLQISDAIDEVVLELTKDIVAIARDHHMVVESCAEKVDLSALGVEHGSCIDKHLIEKLFDIHLAVKKDKTQREECGCYESIDIGAYNTCKHGCKYCYANFSPDTVIANAAKYDPNSPILCGSLDPENDKITERKVKSLIDGQLDMFDVFGIS